MPIINKNIERPINILINFLFISLLFQLQKNRHQMTARGITHSVRRLASVSEPSSIMAGHSTASFNSFLPAIT
jgi:hypothetical protein